MPYFITSAILAAIDLVFKQKIEQQPPEEFPRDMPHTKGKIKLYRNHNEGFPFGFLQQYPELIRLVPFGVVSAVAGILAWLCAQKGQRVRKLGFAMIIGGGISNLYDRFARHYVIDYFSFQFGWLKRIVFNLGDLFIFAGALVTVVTESFYTNLTQTDRITQKIDLTDTKSYSKMKNKLS